MISKQTFYSKILLFGEYSIIQNSMGLAIPYPLFEGKLLIKSVSDSSKAIYSSNRELKAFGDYLKLKQNSGELNFDFDVLSMEFDIAQGLFFQSNIPQGFGIGSSGALTASLFDRYVYDKNIDGENPTEAQIISLKRILGQMESHFHGSSSGVDPLSSFLNKPLLIRSKTQIEVPTLPYFNGSAKGAIFLLNTGRPRKTEPLVNLFLEKCRNLQFMEQCKNELIVYNDNCIKAFLQYDRPSLFENLSKLSRFQYEHFEQMIPPVFRQAWQHGLETQDYKLKLCGAGGGGFILGFCEDFTAIRHLLQDYQIRVVYKI